MFGVNGLYGHMQRNNAKMAVLALAFLLQVFVAQSLFRIGPVIGQAMMTLRDGGSLSDVNDPLPALAGNALAALARFAGLAPPSDKPRIVFHRIKGNEWFDDTVRFRSIDVIPAQDDTQLPKGMALVVWAAGKVNFFDRYALFLAACSVVYLAFGAWWNSLYIRHATRAKPLRRGENPALHDLVNNLAISAGMPCPAIEIVESPHLNAYASGLTPQQGRIGLSRGLVEKLDRAELEAVVAHELTHIRSGDSRLMAVTRACVDTALPYRSGGRRPSPGQMAVTAASIGILAWTIGVAAIALAGLLILLVALTTVLAKAVVFHSREFVADAGAIEMTRDPAALISALRRIAGDDSMPVRGLTTQAMLFSGKARGLFSTHPAVESRIAAIEEHGRVRKEEWVEHRARAVPKLGLQARGFGKRASAGAFAMNARSRSVFAEDPVFGARIEAAEPLAAAAPAGDSLFEKWILSGRADRAKIRARRVVALPVKLLLWFQLSAALLSVLAAALMGLF